MPPYGNLMRASAHALLRDPVKRLLTSTFGHGWRRPLLHASQFSAPIIASKGETVVLGGCYLTHTIRMMYDVVGPAGRIIAIEANPANVETVRRELAADEKLSRASNITLVAKGIWDKPGRMTFVASAGDDAALDKIADAHLRDFSYAKVAATRSFDIEVDSLDNILRDVGVKHVDLVILTINDAELLALDGIAQLLRDNPHVRFVVNSEWPYPCREVKQKLTKNGYRVYARRIGRSSLERIYAFRADGTGNRH
jgi:FkbM family methyltransferase